jgi:FixJ family two-component response regulator
MPDGAIVAVVEDEPNVRKAIVLLLRAYGFHPKAFASAEEFLARDSREEEPACLVLDISLGGISGIDLQHRLTAKACAVPVIIITAAGDEITKRRAEDAGCIAYLRKPFLADLLICAIKRALAN